MQNSLKFCVYHLIWISFCTVLAVMWIDSEKSAKNLTIKTNQAKTDSLIQVRQSNNQKFREGYDAIIESKFKSQGYNIIVYVGGERSDILNLSYIFFNESWHARFEKDLVYSLWRTMGFKKVIMRNGTSFSKEINLSKYQELELNEH